MNADEVAVDNRDLDTFLLCTVRYALGRSTYIVGTTAELVRKYRPHLEPKLMDRIRTEIQEELERAERFGRTVGMQMDHDVWARLVEDLS